MISLDYLQTLYAYDAWASRRVLDTAARLAPTALEAAPLSGLGSLQQIFTHCVSATWIWRSRLAGVSPQMMLDPSNFRTLAAIRMRWEAELSDLRTLIAGLDADSLAAPLDYLSTRGAPQRTPRWQILAHVVNHGTQHRSEAAALLTALGQSPGDLDMIVFFREPPEAA
ncbi:MAG: hypothetical protein HGA65_14845 [Oscillochloris sp.]|nr:hypothetical protein [Oscillochloris sp.]